MDFQLTEQQRDLQEAAPGIELPGLARAFVDRIVPARGHSTDGVNATSMSSRLRAPAVLPI